MLYRFIDTKGTFIVRGAHRFQWYVPLTNPDGTILSAIGPNLSGDIKRDNNHFLTVPASVEDLRSSPLCRRDFFIRADNRLFRLSQGPVAEQETGLLYQKLRKRCGPLDVEVLNFVPCDRAAEVMQVKVRNRSRKTVSITPTSFIPLYGRGEKNLRDHRHVSSLLNRVDLDPHGIFLKPTMIFDEKGHVVNTTIYYCRGYESDGRAPAGQFPTLDMFYGRGDIFRPDAVEGPVAPVRRKDPCFDGKEACAALRFCTKKLRPGQEAGYILVMGIDDSPASIARTTAALHTSGLVLKSLERTKQCWQERVSSLTIDLDDPQRNGWLVWVGIQPTLRRIFGCSFLPHFDYGKGGRGWRDLWQDALTLLLTEPAKAKAIIERSFQGVRLDGSNATIITEDGFLADRNTISRVWMDHGVWPYLTIRSYIDRSADIGILLRKTTYFRDHQLRRAQAVDPGFSQADFIQRDRFGRVLKTTILEHLLVQNLVPFFNVGTHNIARLENADWNDGLDMAPQRGESAAFSCMYSHNLADICRFLERLKKRDRIVSVTRELLLLLDTLGRRVAYDSWNAKQKRLSQYYDAIERVSGDMVAIPIDGLIKDLQAKACHMAQWLGQREWLSKAGFFNGYYDNRARRVEGIRQGRITMFLASQVFAVMSGVAADDQVRQIWQSIRAYLHDPVLQGFRLNTDMRKPVLDLGRAYGFAFGDKENGAFFSHMNVMLANALYSRMFVEEGRQVMESLYRMSASDAACIPPMLPEYFNGQGRGLYLYLTGSASWYMHTLIGEVLGVTFDMGMLVLRPKLMREDFSGRTVTMQCSHRGRRLIFTFCRPVSGSGPYALRRVRVNRRVYHAENGCVRIPASHLSLPCNVLTIELQ
ncbi:MAG TPA: cellobiose phosphorylase [Candidatus Omnitrophota bacterium]|nr:cellobiose phosphorylase [Candidatus Omnitrophota bacterium]HQO37796.1 cellobiose phosphorylase [Candidatus Omnitrophota bacterium]HQQ05647.1 cellobiose phosphorylase [Candidatus Omnitrophota bacterium]